MFPTVHDARGIPVAGLSGVAPKPVPRPAAQRFQELLQHATARAALPSAPAVSPGWRATPVRRAVPVSPRGVVPTAGTRRSVPQTKQMLAASIRRAAAHAGVEPGLSVAVARAESSLDPAARSPDGKSVGTFQVTHATAAEMRRKIAAGHVRRPPGVDDVALGVGYLRYLHDLFGRNARLARGLDTVAVPDAGERRMFAVAAYNAGEGRVARAQAQARSAGGDPTRFADVRPYLPGITKAYVSRVAAFAREEAPTTALG